MRSINGIQRKKEEEDKGGKISLKIKEGISKEENNVKKVPRFTIKNWREIH